jgi:Phospholipase_D-nuclease N-terminal
MSVLATVSFGEALLIVLEIAVLFVWIWAGIKVLIDVFRSPDLSNWSRAGWLLLIVMVPLLGVVIYMVVRGNEMSIRETGDEVWKDLESRGRATTQEDSESRGRATTQNDSESRGRATA